MHLPIEGRKKVFVSYSHRDSEWLNRLQIHLKDLERRGLIELWDDTKIQPGAQWRKEISDALDSARVAVLLFSADFIASDFIAQNELPPLLTAAENNGVTILPLILSPSRFEKIKSLARFQSINPPSKPLIGLPKVEQEEYLVKLSEAVLNAVEESVEEEHRQGDQCPAGETVLNVIDESVEGLANSSVSTTSKPKGPLRPLREWAWEAVILTLSVIIIITLWLVNVGEFNVKVEVQSDTVTVGTSGDWSQEENFTENRSASGRRIKVDHLNTIGGPALAKPVTDSSRNARLEINSDNVQLTKLKLQGKCQLKISSTVSGHQLSIRNGDVRAALNYQGNTTLHIKESGGQEQPYPLPLKPSGGAPGAIFFSSDASEAVPSTITIDRPLMWKLKDLQINWISFQREQSPSAGSVSFESAIKGGMATVIDTQVSESLRPDDHLILEGLKNQKRLEISGGDGFNLLFEGSVSSIKSGPKGHERDLTPSWLDYLYHKQPMYLLYGAVLFLFGILLSVRKAMIVGKGQDEGRR